MSQEIENAFKAVRVQAERDAVDKLLAELKMAFLVSFHENCTEDYRKGFGDCRKRAERVMGEWSRA